jgi:hypothetical protein
MNVHRRDRARLKLAGVTGDGGNDNQILSPSQSYMIQPYPPQVASLQHAYVANPDAVRADDTNPDSISSVADHPPRSLAQASTARSVWGNQVLSAPLISMPPWIDNGKNKVVFQDTAQSALNHTRSTARTCSNQKLQVGTGEYKMSILGCLTRRDFSRGSDCEESIHVGCKRRRVDFETSPVVICSFSRKQQQDGEDNGEGKPNDPKVFKLCPSSPVEELDLELRLGEAPKVK